MKHICEQCGVEHDGSYGSGRFCSAECARKFSSHHINYSDTKSAVCVDCGKPIIIKYNASIKTCRCDVCKLKRKYKLRNINSNWDGLKCSICGREKTKIGEKCTNEFCNKHNIQQFRSLIKYFGFDKNKLGTCEAEQEFFRVREMLYDLYHRKHLSSNDISKQFCYPSSSNLTDKIFRYLEIPVKNTSQATVENYLSGKLKPVLCPTYKNEWHTTWDGKEVFLRSSYEIDYANELDKNKIEYQVEGLRIKYYNTTLKGYHCAIPDFYLPNTNTIVEIKSNWTLDIQEMKDKVKAYKEKGYNFILMLEHRDRTDLILET